jgi:hypothetical protein
MVAATLTRSVPRCSVIANPDFCLPGQRKKETRQQGTRDSENKRPNRHKILSSSVSSPAFDEEHAMPRYYFYLRDDFAPPHLSGAVFPK